MDKWLSDYIEIELNKPSILEIIANEGFVKVNMKLRHFIVFEKGPKRILYNHRKGEIDTIYDVRKVFGFGDLIRRNPYIIYKKNGK